MAIEVKNADVIVKVVKERLDAMAARLQPALDDEIVRIQLRTQRGQDVDGNAFPEYTPGYAERRRKRGRKVSPPDLLFTGNMLNSMQARVERTPDGATGTIYFASAREAAKAAGNQRRRKFFGLSDEQVARIKKTLTEG